MDGTKELSNLDPLKRELLEARLTGSNKVIKTFNLYTAFLQIYVIVLNTMIF